MRLRKGYAAGVLLLLAVESAIAAFVHDHFVRPHLGDSLAVILVYCAIRAVTRLEVTSAATAAFLFACAIEIGQRYDMVDRLGLGGIRVARIVLGTGFDPMDFLAYATGALFILIAEALFSARRTRP